MRAYGSRSQRQRSPPLLKLINRPRVPLAPQVSPARKSRGPGGISLSIRQPPANDTFWDVWDVMRLIDCLEIDSARTDSLRPAIERAALIATTLPAPGKPARRRMRIFLKI